MGALKGDSSSSFLAAISCKLSAEGMEAMAPPALAFSLLMRLAMPGALELVPLWKLLDGSLRLGFSRLGDALPVSCMELRPAAERLAILFLDGEGNRLYGFWMSLPFRVPISELSWLMYSPPAGNSFGSLHSSFITSRSVENISPCGTVEHQIISASPSLPVRTTVTGGASVGGGGVP